MKPRYTLAVLMLLICLNIFGQQAKTVSIQGQPQKTSTQVSTNQQELILHLQAENAAMQKQLEKMEKEVELYRGDIRSETSKKNTDMALWLAVLTIIMTILGVIVPLILSRRNENFMERMLNDVKQQANSAEKQAQEATTQAIQAKQAVTDIEELKKHVTEIEGKINKDTIAAIKAAKEAEAVKYFAQATIEKDPVLAIGLYTAAIKLKTDFAEAYNNRGNVKQKKGDLEGALNDYNEAIRIKGYAAEPYFNRAKIELMSGDNMRALEDCNKAIEINPRYSDAYYNRGIIKRELKDSNGALNDFNKVIELNPTQAKAYLSRGTIKYELNDIQGALLDINKSIEYDRTDHSAYYNRGMIK